MKKLKPGRKDERAWENRVYTAEESEFLLAVEQFRKKYGRHMHTIHYFDVMKSLGYTKCKQ